ncbi:hypothetical protein ABZ953_06455 [Streptomyces sp. NPDC046465]|uniref:hypothetical protein n=1 Tax=Streptomyces sp. NPDC046465 TaxID=3155810 RepID=UPI0033C840B2
MPSSSQTPDGGQQPEPSTEDFFRELTAELAKESYTPFRALFEQAQCRLQHESPHVFEPTLIGRRAWEGLHAEEQETALNDLFYAYWSVQEFERDEQERYAAREAESLLEAFDVTSLMGEVDRQPGAEVLVGRAQLARVLAELERLQSQALDGGDER